MHQGTKCRAHRRFVTRSLFGVESDLVLSIFSLNMLQSIKVTKA